MSENNENILRDWFKSLTGHSNTHIKIADLVEVVNLLADETSCIFDKSDRLTELIKDDAMLIMALQPQITPELAQAAAALTNNEDEGGSEYDEDEKVHELPTPALVALLGESLTAQLLSSLSLSTLASRPLPPPLHPLLAYAPAVTTAPDDRKHMVQKKLISKVKLAASVDLAGASSASVETWLARVQAGPTRAAPTPDRPLLTRAMVRERRMKRGGQSVRRKERARMGGLVELKRKTNR